MNKHCVLFLARTPTPILQQAVQELKTSYSIDSFIISDSPTHCKHSVYIPNEVCIKNNYRYCHWPSVQGKSALAWDRGLYFSAEQSDYDYYWFIEDDVYFRDTRLLYSMIERFTGFQYDFIATGRITLASEPSWSHWHLASGFFDKPVAAFMPVSRISKRLLKKVSNFAKQYERLAFHELMIASLAAENDMSFAEIKDIAPFVQMRYRPALTKEEIEQKANCILHPWKGAL